MNPAQTIRLHSQARALGIGMVILSISLALTMNLRSKHRALESEWHAWQAKAARMVQPGKPERLPATGVSKAGLLAELQAAVEREQAARMMADKRAATAESKLPPLTGEMVISFGPIEQMAHEAALALQGTLAETGPAFTAQAETTEHLIALAPEIRRFEDTPAEIARFQTHLLSEFSALDDAGTKRLGAALDSEFTALKAQGFNASRRPADQADSWDLQRAQLVRGMAARLRPLLPAAGANAVPLEALLNLGVGIRLEQDPRGHPVVRPFAPNTHE